MDLPDWNGRVVACIATGPSLTREQLEAVEAVRGDKMFRVLAVNDAGLPHRQPFVVHSCDIWYAPDHRFWWHYREQINDRPASIRVGAEPKSERVGLVHATLTNVDGGHAGVQALRLAIDLGARLVLLLGYDCRARPDATNYFGHKPPELTRTKPEPYEAWVPRYRKLVVPVGTTVINCSPGSAIDAFERGEITEVLKAPRIAA